MLVDLNDKEVCLIAQSVESVDWDYSGNGDTAKSVLRKMCDAARKMLEARKGADHAD